MSSRVDPTDAITQQGHYAGAVTRLAAFALDQTAATVTFAFGTAVVAWIIALVTAQEVEWNPNEGLTAALFVVWLFLWYAYPWSVSGKSLGMAVLGIRVVRADGSPASPGNAVKRTIFLPLSFLTLGIGFLPIVFARSRRALHDKLAGTSVVYSWDARGAKLRFLARQQRDEDPAAI